MKRNQWLTNAARRLAQAGIETARLDAELLLAHHLGTNRLALITVAEQILSDQDTAILEELLIRRLGREPMAYILGYRDFWSLRLAVTPDTLIPRPDSETVIEAVHALRPEKTRAWRILDLGMGSGALLLALLQEYPRAWGLGADISPAACAVARGNAVTNGLANRAAFVCSDWTDAVGTDTSFDIIVCNPPYVAHTDKAQLSSDVRSYEPALALFAHGDGLAAYRHLSVRLTAVAASDALLVLEVGQGQAEAVTRIMADTGWVPGPRFKDLGDIDRAVTFQRRLQ